MARTPFLIIRTPVAVAIALVLLLWWWQGISLWWLAVPVVLYLGAVAYGSSQISSGFFIQARCKGPASAKQIAITFDDGPVEATAQVLHILGQQQVPATFFCIGHKVQQRPELAQRIVQEGHIIGNHSFSHSFLFSFSSVQTLVKEITDTDKAIAHITGKQPHLFRPPYGVTNPAIAKALRLTKHEPIGWSVRSMDTVLKEERKLFNNMVTALQPGAVYLFHDTSAATVAMLGQFLEEAKRQGFEVVGIDRLLNVKAYA